MRATVAYLADRHRVELREESLEPREDQVLVRIAACGICRGDVDLFSREQDSPRPFGHEPVGRIVALGPWVTGLSEGDWVVGCISGSFATHVLARADEVYRVPPELGDAACLAEPLKCVTTVLRAARPDFGDVVVVMGCGFMGLSVVAALREGWQRALIAVDPIETRRSLATSFGASHVLGAEKDVAKQIRALTDGRGADVAIEFTGDPDVPGLAGRLLRPRGRLVLGGGYSPRENLYFRAITAHHVPPAFSPNEGDDFVRAIDALARGRFPGARLVTHRRGLTEIQPALESARDDPDYIKGIILNDVSENSGVGAASGPARRGEGGP